MNRVRNFSEDIVDKRFNNAEKARIWYLNNIYGQEKKRRNTGNKINRNIDMLNLYDSVKKILLLETDGEQSDATDMPELETEEST